MLCEHCRTVVEFAKEDYVKMVFQNGKKFLYHTECFNLNFQRRNDEAQNSTSGTRVGSLDAQGNLFLGFDDDIPRNICKPST